MREDRNWKADLLVAFAMMIATVLITVTAAYVVQSMDGKETQDTGETQEGLGRSVLEIHPLEVRR